MLARGSAARSVDMTNVLRPYNCIISIRTAFPASIHGAWPHIIKNVAEPSNPKPQLNITPVISALRAAPAGATEERTVCERCGAEMYRMHAVWRCPQCRFKTDCCGW